jgi:NCAIR mutase (PurE)-related protein
MTPDRTRELLEQVRAGKLPVEAAMERLRHLPFEDLGFAKVDHHRALRHGMPEVIFAQGKTPEQVAAIAAHLLEGARNVLITRAEAKTAALVKRKIRKAEYFPLSRAIRIWGDRTVRGKGKIAVVCAGTSDIPVAEEARVTAEVMGNEVDAIHDVGVAGIHRRK